MKKLLLLLFLIPNLVMGEEKNPLISYKPLGNGCIYTIDLTITDNLQDKTIISVGNSQIRNQGVIIQTYHNSGMGKSTFQEFDNAGIVLMMQAIGLPIKQWKERGVPNEAIIRIVLTEPESCSESIGLIS